jgi:hypothetical protein
VRTVEHGLYGKVENGQTPEAIAGSVTAAASIMQTDASPMRIVVELPRAFEAAMKDPDYLTAMKERAMPSTQQTT